MHLTTKQITLLTAIVNGNGPNDPLDLDQLLDKIDYETTKQSLQFSIRALINRNMIVKDGPQRRRGRMRQVISPTPQGRDIIGNHKPSVPAYVVSEDDELMETLDPS
jgi:DNA-binding MarR family transcriptional regulator